MPSYKLMLPVAALAAVALWFLRATMQTPRIAHRAACLSNLKQIALAFSMYTEDYNHKMPPAGRVSATEDNGWTRALFPYHKSPPIFRCTALRYFTQDSTLHTVRYTSYYFNANLAAAEKPALRDLADVLLLGEGEVASGDYACSSFSNCSGTSEGGPVGRVPLEAITRHVGGSNFAFADGHVKWHSLQRMLDGMNRREGLRFAPKHGTAGDSFSDEKPGSQRPSNQREAQ